MNNAPQVQRLIARNAALYPDAVASRMDGRETTWGAFAGRVAGLAGGLRGLGLDEGDRVAMLALNSEHYLEFLFATAWAGCVFVPVNTRLAAPEVVHWLGDSGAKVLIVDDAFTKMVPDLLPHLPELAHVVYAGAGDTPGGMTAFDALATAPVIDASARGGDDLVGLFYTGGTTGRSKGVMLSHGNLIHNAMVALYHWQFGDQPVHLHAAPMFHLADGAGTFAITMQGGAHAYVPSFSPQGVLEAIARDRATSVILVPAMVNMMVQQPDAAGHDLTSLTHIGYGAAPMPQAVLEAAMKLVPGVNFVQGYGQTECAPLLTVLTADRHVLDGPLAGKAASVGRPVVGMDVRILDPEGREVPTGTVGEVCARGPSVMLGYWNQPQKTAETWAHGWHHTGDGGYMDKDGFVWIVDRLKDMIITGGENVYSAEVENALYAHPDIVECAVIGVPDDTWGERVHAIVRLRPGAETDAAAIRAFAHTRIAGYKCPRTIDFTDDPLPASGAGKILKTELRKPFWAGEGKQVH